MGHAEYRPAYGVWSRILMHVVSHRHHEQDLQQRSAALTVICCSCGKSWMITHP
jgi:hypothetical protein